MTEHEALRAIATKIEGRLDEIVEALYRVGDALMFEKTRLAEIQVDGNRDTAPPSETC